MTSAVATHLGPSAAAYGRRMCSAIATLLRLPVDARSLSGRIQLLAGDEATVLPRPDVHHQITGRAADRDPLQRFYSEYTVGKGILQAVIAAAAFNWSWLVAVGAAPLLLTLLPCAVMCGLGLCLMNKADASCHGNSPKTPDRASQA